MYRPGKEKRTKLENKQNTQKKKEVRTYDIKMMLKIDK